MDSAAVHRERRVFAWGVVALMVLAFAVFTAIAYCAPGWASFLFAIEILLIVTWMLRHQRISKALQTADHSSDRS